MNFKLGILSSQNAQRNFSNSFTLKLSFLSLNFVKHIGKHFDSFIKIPTIHAITKDIIRI